ncbi:MAG: esterase [Allomuricauda sp.]|nr:MAG: esterase [Allomuricauda sp.]
MKLSKHLFAILFSLLLLSCGADDGSTNEPEFNYEVGLQLFEFTWENRSRSYQVYFPDAQFASSNLPVLFVLHGGGGNATGMIEGTFGRFNELADLHGFVVVYPEAFESSWNDGRDVPGIATAWDENIDDVGFIAEIVTRLQQDLTLDTDRIFTTGISNGGFMSSRLLCDRSDLFRGGAIVTATLGVDHFRNCTPTQSNSVLVINGTEDPLVPYEGGFVTILGQTRGEILSTDAYMQFWATANGCSTSPLLTDLPDTEDDGTSVQRLAYTACSNASVQLYRIEGGGHTWPGGQELLPALLVGRTSQEFVACDLIWSFFDSL